MEKAKKLFGYIVVLVAIVCLFVAGINVQGIASYAAEEGAISSVPSISYKGAPKVTDVVVIDENGNEETVDAGLVNVVSIKDVQNNPTKKKAMEAAKNDAENADFGNKVNEAIDEAAKTLDPEGQYDRTVMIVTNVFEVEMTGELAQKAKEGGVKVTFQEVADIVLFKGFTQGSEWEFLEIVDESTPKAAAPLNAGVKRTTTTVIMNGSGTVVFEKLSQDAIEKFKQRQQEKDGPCCDDCKEGCVFCKYFCKDGKCYCWTMYLVIALGCILIILLVALIIVKAKAKKVVDVQDQPREPEDMVGPEEESVAPQQYNQEDTND